MLAAASALEGVTQLAAVAASPPTPAAAPAPGGTVAAPLPPPLPPAGLWSDGEEAAEGPAWTEAVFLDDVAALPSAAAALAPPPPASSQVALRFAHAAALPAFCARACAEEDAAVTAADGYDDDAGREGLRWALLRSSAAAAAEPVSPPLVTALQLLPRCDAAAALASLLDADDAADAPLVGWAVVTFGTGAFLPAAARAAFAARPSGGPGGRDSAAALLACVDALRGAHGPLCVECYDLRSGAPLPFQLTHAA